MSKRDRSSDEQRPEPNERASSVGGESGEIDSLLERVAEAPERDPDATWVDRSWPEGGQEPGPVFRTGDLVGDRFLVLEEIGSGGFGRVFLANDRELGRRVAIKAVNLGSGRPLSPEEVQLFEREAKVTARLNHPNIVTIHDWGSWKGIPYLVLEHLAGEPLSRRLAREPVSRSEALSVLRSVASALVHAHGAGVLHLDLKPLNVFCLDGGHVKVLDFGMAQLDLARASVLLALGDAADRGERPLVGGTPDYMAPEQWRDEGVDARTDVWAAGVLLFELLTGGVPFPSSRGRRPTEPGAQVPSLRERARRVPAAIDRIATRALRTDPSDRFQSAAEMLAAVEAAERSRERRRLGLWAAAGVAVLLAIALGVELGRVGPPPAPPLSLPVATHRQLTYVGDAVAPSISRDGTRIAYVRKDGLYTQRLAGGPALRLFRGKICWDPPKWPPHSNEIVFCKILPKEYRWPWSYVAVPWGGGPGRTLHGVRHQPTWSPEGTRVASASSYDKELSITDLRTGRTIKVPIPHRTTFRWVNTLDWSPTGRHLLFGGHSARFSAIWTVRPDGTHPHQVARSPGTIGEARWGPGGKEIYFIRARLRTREIVRVSIDAKSGKALGTPRVILSGLESGNSIWLSADGQRLVYTRTLNRGWISELSPQGTTTPLTPRTHDIGSPAVSPDGRSIVFARAEGDHNDLFLVPAGGGQPKRVTNLRSTVLSAAWSPSGKEIAFIARSEGPAGLWRVRPDGTGLRRFAKAEPSGQLAWAPNREILYQRPGNQNFHLLDPETEKERPLLRDDTRGWIFFPRYSPDGRQLAFHWNTKATGPGLWVRVLRGGALRLLRKGFWNPFQWSSDGQWIFGVGTGDWIHASEIAKIPARGGSPRSLFRWPQERSLLPLHVSKDEKRILVLELDNRSDVWLAEHFDAP